MALSTEKHDIASTVDRMARRMRSVGGGGGTFRANAST
jgi:hypothetical protein